MPAQTMYDLSVDWYRGRIDDDWEPRSTEETKRILDAHGLVGEFWAID